MAEQEITSFRGTKDPKGNITNYQESKFLNPWDVNKGYIFNMSITEHNRFFPKVQYKSKLNDTELAILFKLVDYVTPKTNMLFYVGNSINDVKPIDKATIMEITGKSKRTVERFLKTCFEEHILKEIQMGYGKEYKTAYFINPFVCLAGNRITLIMFQIFTDECKKYLPKDIFENFCKLIKHEQYNIHSLFNNNDVFELVNSSKEIWKNPKSIEDNYKLGEKND